MREHRGAIATRVWNGDHEVNGTAQSLSHRHTLQLRGAQLCLEIQEGTLHLHGNQPAGTVQNHVNSSPIRRHTYGNLQPALSRLGMQPP